MKKCVLYSMLSFALATLCCTSCSNRTISFKGDYPDPVIIEMTDKDGVAYKIEAVEGQVCVWTNDNISPRNIRKAIQKAGGKVVAQIPKYGYYLVEIPMTELHNFMAILSAVEGVEQVYPNMTFEACSADSYVLDTYHPDTTDLAPHGVMVEYAMAEFDNTSFRRAFNIGNKDENSICTSDKKSTSCVNTEFFALDTISHLAGASPIIINMSYGASLPKRFNEEGKRVHYYWRDATKEEKKSYQESYLSITRTKIRNLKPMDGKDFVVVVAAGNTGVKEFDKYVISYLRQNLTPEEIAVVEKHFLFVTADESKRAGKYLKEYNQYKSLVRQHPRNSTYKSNRDKAYRQYDSFNRYSNEMESGHYDPWVTSVDLSDFVYDGKEKRGTSFAAPRAAGMLSSVINETDLSGAEVLAVAKEVTYKYRKLTKETLLEAAKQKKENPDNGYTRFGALLYRLVPDEASGLEKLELRNTVDVKIRVRGTLLNTIARHDDENVIEIDELIEPRATVFVEGFIENECTITSVDAESDPQRSTTNSQTPEQVVRSFLIASVTGDMVTVKACTTSDIYQEAMFEYQQMKHQLSSKNRAKAEQAIRDMNMQTIETGENRVAVKLNRNGRRMSYYLRNNNGKWLIYDYAIGNTHVPKNMRRRYR